MPPCLALRRVLDAVASLPSILLVPIFIQSLGVVLTIAHSLLNLVVAKYMLQATEPIVRIYDLHLSGSILGGLPAIPWLFYELLKPGTLGERLRSLVKPLDKSELKREDDILLTSTVFSQTTLLAAMYYYKVDVSVDVTGLDVKIIMTMLAAVFLATRWLAKLRNNNVLRFSSIMLGCVLVHYDMLAFISLHQPILFGLDKTCSSHFLCGLETSLAFFMLGLIIEISALRYDLV